MSHGNGEPGGGERLRRAARLARSGARRYRDEFVNALRRFKAGEPFPFTYEPAKSPLSASWLGHATVLLRIGDQWVLTDPVLSERIGIKVGPMTMGVSRLLPAIRPDALPPLDLILLSHAHFDHLDKPTLQQLASKRTRVITAASTRALVPRGFADVRELAWDKTLDAGPLDITAIRPAHWGARTAYDRHRGFNSYLVELERGRRRVLYAGDTARTDAFSKLGGLDLSIFGIGAYDPWIHAHASPEEAWEMHRGARGEYILPMHHSTFKLSDEPVGEPMKRLLAAAGEHGERVVGRELGQMWTHPDT